MGLSGHAAYSIHTWIQSQHSCAAAKRCTKELLNLAEYIVQHHDPVPRKVFKYLLEPTTSTQQDRLFCQDPMDWTVPLSGTDTCGR
jgi:hypothetical protein